MRLVWKQYRQMDTHLTKKDVILISTLQWKSLAFVCPQTIVTSKQGNLPCNLKRNLQSRTKLLGQLSKMYTSFKSRHSFPFHSFNVVDKVGGEGWGRFFFFFNVRLKGTLSCLKKKLSQLVFVRNCR